MGDIPLAIECFSRAKEIDGEPDAYSGQFMYANARAGNAIDVNEYIEKMGIETRLMNKRSHVLTLASLYGALREFDKMFQLLNEALDMHLDIFYFIHIPYYRSQVGNDTRYLELKKRLKLDKYKFEEV